jgi:bacillithiol system protein YtxJ
MNWIKLESANQISTILEQSATSTVLIFKHSTRCSISSTSLDRLERAWEENLLSNPPAYYLDLINFRSISTLIAESFNVEHQSPQVLLIKNQKCIYHASHFDIQYAEIKKQLLA